MQIACATESSLWSCFLEASVEDMLLMAHVDACTPKFYFCKFFLPFNIFACQETSENDPMERLFLRKMVSYRDSSAYGKLDGLLLLHFHAS
jgi:hypothetical protein